MAYTWGSYGELAAVASAEASPLDLSDGANHTVLFELKNVGLTPVRVVPYLKHLRLETALGETPDLYGHCVNSHAYQMFQGSDGWENELPPGGTIGFEVRVQSNGTHLATGENCAHWLVTAGETYYLHAAIEGLPATNTLPIWVGTLETDPIALVA